MRRAVNSGVQSEQIDYLFIGVLLAKGVLMVHVTLTVRASDTHRSIDINVGTGRLNCNLHREREKKMQFLVYIEMSLLRFRDTENVWYENGMIATVVVVAIVLTCR